MKTRFAPSPTGYMHVGNCRTLLVNWLLCQKEKGTFILRMDDTDTARSKTSYETALIEDIEWLGLSFDAYAKQSDRLSLYNLAAEKLKNTKRLYPCYETAEDLEIKRKQKAALGLPPIYDREALKLTDTQKAKFESEGRKPHWRFLIEDSPIEWHDMVRGPIHFEGKHLSDPVLIREDGVPLYTLASVVDDMDMEITHIVRGEDHLSNTAVQKQIWDALGITHQIHFAHLSLLQGAEGEQLSKRLGTQSIRDMRDEGILPMALNSLLSKIGTSDPLDVFNNLTALVQEFDLSKFSRATPKFSRQELEHLNTKLLHKLSYEEVQKHINFPNLRAEFWETVKPNISKLSELSSWWISAVAQ